MVASKASLENIDNAKAPASSLAAAEKTIENQQLDDILPSYIGSVEKHTQTHWVYEKEEMVCRSVTYVPGLYNIFDEILLNAADNPSMDSINVVIDADKNQISVCGYGVPVEFHQEECVYMPEMIKKTTGGNGFGATLTNISTEFTIEIADGKRSLKKYKQVFENNMGKKYDPVIITMCNKSENWTKVTFTPDLKKFNMTELDNDVVALMSKRVLEIAGCLGKTVDLNGKQVPIKSFSDYVDLYLSAASKSRTEPLPRMTEKVNDRWEVCVSLSDGRFQQVSFVNSIATIKGGTHVDYVTSQVTEYIVGIVNKKKKYPNVKTHNVKNHLWVFVNALIDNPAFDSQTKERLTLPESSFGSKCQLSKDILQKGLLEHFLFSWKTWEQNEALKISDGAKTETVKVEGLMDAEKAGGEESEACTLILVEGRSAQSLAKLGRNVLGRAFYGAFPIQGKFLNVSKAKTSKIANNELLVNIKKILGLKQGRKYYDAKSLRYGRVMLLSDQDPDGSHIKGLLINYFHHFWPLLLKIKPSFIVQFITPIMKVTHPTKEAQLFYSMLRYEDWESEIRQSGNTTEWTRKYCKGLASIDSADAKGYFTNLKFHQKDFVWEGVQDGEAIKLAFSKNKTEARRKWLSDCKPGTHDLQKPTISFKDFVYNDLVEFSRANLERSIPSLVDGLKPSQRKILFCAFEKNFVEDVLVSKLSGHVLDLSVYRHGEQNLDNTIIGMALDYVGSNNVNLLHPSSQFGTRALGKKDAADPRYIFTKLSPATMVLFPKDDDVLLERLFGDGKKIEPTWYIPIIPTVLVNGAEGIASGWKTFIPNYNPRDVVKNIKHLIRGENMEAMHPWYRGFTGTIKETASDEDGCTYTITGRYDEVNDTTFRITELPIGTWTDDYEKFLKSMKGVSFIQNGDDDRIVDFQIKVENKTEAAGFLKKFKLTTTFSTKNMYLFDKKNVLKKYSTPEKILQEFFDLRLEFYKKRKDTMLKNLELELVKLDNKMNILRTVLSGESVESKRKKADFVQKLRQEEVRPFPKMAKPVEAAVAGATDGAEESEESSVAPAPSSPFIPDSDCEVLWDIKSLTIENEEFKDLNAQRDQKMKAFEELGKTTPVSLWLKDLEAFERELEKLDPQPEEERQAPKKPAPKKASETRYGKKYQRRKKTT